MIPLDDRAAAGPPTIKLRDVGDHTDLVIYDLDQRDARDMATGETKINPATGKARQEKVIYGIVVGGTGVVTVNDADQVPPAGAEVRVFLGGAKFKAWIDATDTLRVAEGRGVGVGDVARFRFDRTEKSQTKGYADVKLWDIRVRAARPDEASLVADAEAAYHARRAAPTITLDTGGGGGWDAPAGGWPPGEEPF